MGGQGRADLQTVFDPEEPSAMFPVLGADDVEETVKQSALDAAVEHIKEPRPDLDLRTSQAPQEGRLQFGSQLCGAQSLVPAGGDTELQCPVPIISFHLEYGKWRKIGVLSFY